MKGWAEAAAALLDPPVPVTQEEVFAALGYVPTERQWEFHKAVEYDLLYGGAGGGGKMLRLDELVATPAGWSTIGALRVGDGLFDERGQLCRVTALHPVDPEPTAYRLVFDDGTAIEACAKHQWLTYSVRELEALSRRTPEFREARRSSRPARSTGTRSERFIEALRARNRSNPTPCMDAPTGTVRTTAEIAATPLPKRGRAAFAMPVAKALDLPVAELPIDPYLLGAWLGDGSSTGGGFTGADEEILDHFRDAGVTVVDKRGAGRPYAWWLGDRVWTTKGDGTPGWVNTWTARLREFGLEGNKHIPTVYQRASREQRLEVLRGLMDTDGHACESGSVEFTTTRRALADGVYELIVGLGWKARITEGRAMIAGRDCGPKYRIHWTPGDYVFRLERKRARQKLADRRTTAFRYVISCEPCAPSPMRCITVDSPSSLFLVGRSMLPTHNSKAAVMHALWACAAYPGIRVGIFRRTYDELAESVLPELASVAYGEAIGAVWNATKSELSFPNRALLRLRYLETLVDASRRQGGQYQLLIFEERTLFAPGVADLVIERLRSGDEAIPVLGIRSTTNPGGADHAAIKTRYIDGTDKGRRVYVDEHGHTVRFIQATVDDNPHVDPGYKARLDAIPDPNRRKAMRFGDWDSFSGQFFAEWQHDRHVVQPFPIPVEWDRYVGIDWGYAAPWAVTWGAQDEDGRVWVYRERYARQVGEQAQAREILSAEEDDPEPVVRVADPAMWATRGDADSLATAYEREGCWIERANNDRNAGWSRMHQYLAEGPACPHHRAKGWERCPMLHVFASCVNWIRTVPSLPYSPTRPEDVDTKADDHLGDSTRYLLMAVGEVATIVTIDDAAVARLRTERAAQGRDPDGRVMRPVGPFALPSEVRR